VPLNQTNLIQPHGVLLITDRKSLNIEQASENAEALFGIRAQELVNTSLSEFLNDEAIEKLRVRFDGHTTEKLPFVFSISSGNYLSTIQAADQYLIIEIEKESRPEKHDSFLSIYEELKYAMTAVEAATTTASLCRVAINELQRISGFDKIMIYRFDEEWNGDVIAEIKQEGMDAYLGLKFPSSDIPKQARDLYKKAAYRLIPNVDYEPVRLYPVINPVTKAFTDLSNCNLRSVAGVHLEYLRNMGVMASMSTRIMVDGELWGLIACHHRQPKYLSFEICTVFELLSSVISGRISAVEKHDAFSFKTEMQAIYTGLLEDIYQEKTITESFSKKTGELLKLLNADGVAFSNEGQVYLFGKTPAGPDVIDLVYWLRSEAINKTYHNSHLSANYEPSEKYAGIASGILALPVQPDRGSFIIAFRSEAVQKVNWGGNPNEAVQFESDGKKYHPRNSFRQWQQTVKETSIPWKTEEIEVAESFRNFVVEYTLNRMYN
jgi:chemotaxis family two-component system sensor kinase Cph1